MEARVGGSAEQPWREPSLPTDRNSLVVLVDYLERKLMMMKATQ